MSPATANQRYVVPDVAAFRERQRERDYVPYENVMDEDAPVEGALIVADGWKLGPFPRVKLVAPLDWDRVCAENRSWHFHLQSWDPIGTVLAAYDRVPTPAYLGWAVELGVDWARAFNNPDASSPFAWYDMALGLRAYRLAYLLDVAARSDSISDEEIAWLLAAADIHRELLLDDDSFAAHSNHGFYQAAGQLAMGRRLPDVPGMDDAFDQGTGRFRSLMERHFSDDGIHLEHSPEYQWIIMQSLAGIIGAGLVTDAPIIDLFERIQESTAWLVAPNHRVAMLGDSSPREPKLRRPEAFGNDALRFVSTRGEHGRPPATRTRLFRTGGYAVLRDRWPKGPDEFPDCSYLAQTCAFHSRVHKHADDMSFVWYDRGREILTDSGRYGYVGKVEAGSVLFEEGYHYSDPRRVYVESTRAHNAVEIDARSYPRRRVPFYGSGLREAGESAGVLYTLSELNHMSTVRHVRILMLAPQNWLIVFDWLRDGEDQRHEFRQWLQFAPELSVDTNGPERLQGRFEDGLQVHVAPLLPSRLGENACGQNEPLLGWISREIYTFEPRTSASYLSSEVPTAAFATLLSLGSGPPEPDQQHSRIDVNGRAGRLCWTMDALRHEVAFTRSSEDSLTIEYRTGN